MREQVQRQQGRARPHQRHAEGVEEQRQHRPGQRWRQEQVVHDIDAGSAQQEGKADADLARERDLAGDAVGRQGAHENPAHAGNEQPGELRWPQAQLLGQHFRRGRDEQEQAREIEGDDAGLDVEQGRAQDLAIARRQETGIEGLALFHRQGFGQAPVAERQQHHRVKGEEQEDRAPVEPDDDPAAEDGRHGRGDGKDHRHQRQQTRRRRIGIQVADDGAADHHAGAGRDTLQDAEEP